MVLKKPTKTHPSCLKWWKTTETKTYHIIYYKYVINHRNSWSCKLPQWILLSIAGKKGHFYNLEDLRTFAQPDWRSSQDLTTRKSHSASSSSIIFSLSHGANADNDIFHSNVSISIFNSSWKERLFALITSAFDRASRCSEIIFFISTSSFKVENPTGSWKRKEPLAISE